MIPSKLFTCCAFVSLAVCSLTSADDAADFAREIRPILSSACFQCHGPDDSQREAELRLDTEDGLFADLGGHAAFVPGKPHESEALRRIVSDDPDERMPPPDSEKTLSTDEIKLIERWIRQGASWSQHWAFVAPRRHDVPESLVHDAWVRNPIDAFVLARLKRERLTPSPRADRTTLVRRLSLDLIGLPPTVDELDAFLADDSQDAYQEQVRRLLDSPHYGERWGRMWLDAARYADSDGFEKDKPREVWFYRDWVIDALNRDLPYDQFIVEQIAGDLLPGATQDQIVATGFLRNSMLNEEGGIDPEEFRMLAMFDRMDTLGKGILGFTLQCGQCHSHKYDPLTQRDYYRVFAFLNNCHEAQPTVYTTEQQRIRRDIADQIAEVENRLRAQNPDWPRRVAQWEASVRQNQPQWTMLPIENASDNSQRYFRQEDGSLLAQGYAPTRFEAPFSVTTDLPSVRSFRLEMLNHPNLPAGGPGRAVDGQFALSEFKVTAISVRDPKKSVLVKFTRATADFSNQRTKLGRPFTDQDGKNGGFTGPVEYAIDGDKKTAWGIDAGPGRRNQPRKAVFVADRDVAFAGGTKLTFTLAQHHGGWNSDDNQNMNLGRFRISATGDEATADPLPANVREILDVPARQRTDAQTRAVFSYWRTTIPQWSLANEQIEMLWRGHPEGTTQFVLHERGKLRPTHLLHRGDFLNPQDRVTPSTPDFLHSIPPSDVPDRLAFARWLVDRQSPTTARSIVNRIWQAYFGTGIVNTPEDLGSQGGAPTHPKLLDWLAVELMDSGWKLKHIHRLIVQSNVYQQSSQVTPELLERDPDNRWLARGPRFRVDAEIVRDIFLAASGLLNGKVGGPSVHPPAPAFLFQKPASYGPKTWNTDADSDRYRRALYTFRFRSVPYPALQAFDAPSGEFSTVRRPRSNTPLQALTTLNEPLFVECAQALARRTLVEGGATDEARLRYAFRLCVARPPNRDEHRLLRTFLDQQSERLSHDGLDSSRSLPSESGTQAALPDGVTSEHLAAWTVVSRVLLNMDETITKE